MKYVEEKDTVTITYIGKLENGEIFANVTDEQPFVLVLGQEQVPPTLENALIGMAIGQTKSIRLGPDEGYGPRRKDLLHTLNRNSINKQIDPKPGIILSFSIETDGQEHKIPATIIEVNDDTIVVDYNHPLSGHHLIYDIKVTDIDKHLEPK